ncbi:MAG: Pycsar system effector family protein [Chitinophagaceae bacterium]
MTEPEKPTESTRPKIKLRRSPHTEDLVDHYWGSINYVFGLIKASEIKAGLILSFYGILFNFILQNMGVILSGEEDQNVMHILLGIWFLFAVTSIYFSIRCFMPRIEGSYDKNIFYFGDVISKFGTIREFSRTFYEVSLNEEELFDQMGQQIFIISKIATRKFKYVNRSLRFLVLGLLVFLAAILHYAILIIT